MKPIFLWYAPLPAGQSPQHVRSLADDAYLWKPYFPINTERPFGQPDQPSGAELNQKYV